MRDDRAASDGRTCWSGSRQGSLDWLSSFYTSVNKGHFADVSIHHSCPTITTRSHRKKGRLAIRPIGNVKQQSRLVRFPRDIAQTSIRFERAALPYKWRQELGDVDVTVPVPKGTRGRDLVVVIQKKNFSIGLKGKEKILEGELCKEIKVEESTWTLGRY